MLQIKNILLPRDFSDCSNRAVPHALDLAQRTEATLHTFYAEVLHGDPFTAFPSSGSSKKELRKQLKEAAGKHGPGSIDTDSVHVKYAVGRDVAAAPAILTYAAGQNIDAIVMGTHGRRGVRRMMLGSVAEEVVRQSLCPVLTVGRQKEEGPSEEPRVERLLVPVDFSNHALRAVEQAKVLAAFYSARLDLLHVVEEALYPTFYDVGGATSFYEAQPEIEKRTHQEMEATYREAGGPEGEVHLAVRPGRAARAIARYAEEEEMDMVVIPTHGRTGVDRLLIGSVTGKVVRLAPCPVFTIKSFGKSLIAPDRQPGVEKASGEPGKR